MRGKDPGKGAPNPTFYNHSHHTHNRLLKIDCDLTPFCRVMILNSRILSPRTPQLADIKGRQKPLSRA